VVVLRDIALSSGAACTSGSDKPSHVLQAIGLEDDVAYSSLRLGIGRFNTEDEIDYVVERVATEVNRLRELGSFREGHEMRTGSFISEGAPLQ
jgi:cysteine desulfurase